VRKCPIENGFRLFVYSCRQTADPGPRIHLQHYGRRRPPVPTGASPCRDSLMVEDADMPLVDKGPVYFVYLGGVSRWLIRALIYLSISAVRPLTRGRAYTCSIMAGAAPQSRPARRRAATA